MVNLSHCFSSVLFFLLVFSTFHILLPNGTVLLPLWNKPTLKESKTFIPYYFPFDERNIPVATIPSLGKVIGTYSSSSNERKYSAFRGIPYAKSPIGKLRFKDPEPAEPWGLLDATRFGFQCPQLYVPSSEDCLTLNIYTHHGANPLEMNYKPVIVYIHPGAFITGGSRIFNANYFLDRDVVLVTINYRLGAFGFISTGDSEAPGNYGLLDQNLALRFVRDHIHHFGGDPKSVTLMGHSAGGASVEYHILSPRSKGLFKGAIAQSGSTLSNWAFSKESSLEHTKRLAMDLHCKRLTSKDMLDCLRKKSPLQILASDANTRILSRVPGNFPIGSWLPRVDIEREFPFLPAEPEKLIREKRFNSVPLITGIAAHEGLTWQRPIFGMKMEYFKQNHVSFIPIMCGFQFRSDRENLARKIYQYYFSDNNNLKDETALEQMLSDCNFNKGCEDSVRLFSQHNNNPTFHYLFAQNGADHRTIVLYQFGILPLITVEDKMVSKMLLDFWISFASKGIPQSNLLPSRWIPVNGSSLKGYLKIENGKAEMINDSMPFESRLEYLNNIFTP